MGLAHRGSSKGAARRRRLRLGRLPYLQTQDILDLEDAVPDKPVCKWNNASTGLSEGIHEAKRPAEKIPVVMYKYATSHGSPQRRYANARV